MRCEQGWRSPRVGRSVSSRVTVFHEDGVAARPRAATHGWASGAYNFATRQGTPLESGRSRRGADMTSGRRCR